MYEFEKHQRLTEFIQEMANTGKAPQEWTSFIETLNQALSIHDVSGMLCGYFDPDNRTSSATKCKCGREKWEHPKAT